MGIVVAGKDDRLDREKIVEKTTRIQNHHRGAPYSRVVVTPSIYIYTYLDIYIIYTYLHSHTFIYYIIVVIRCSTPARSVRVYLPITTICPFSSPFPSIFQAYEKLHNYGDKRYHTVHCFGARVCHRVWQVLGKYKSEYPSLIILYYNNVQCVS